MTEQKRRELLARISNMTYALSLAKDALDNPMRTDLSSALASTNHVLSVGEALKSELTAEAVRITTILGKG